jgi:hypothetical protein
MTHVCTNNHVQVDKKQLSKYAGRQQRRRQRSHKMKNDDREEERKERKERKKNSLHIEVRVLTHHPVMSMLARTEHYCLLKSRYSWFVL